MEVIGIDHLYLTVRDLARPEAFYDPVMELLGFRKTAEPQKVMIACHMDEIGFYVRYIDDDGRLRVQNVGGFDTRNLFARRVLVQGFAGEDLVGVMTPAGRPIHIATEEEKKKTYKVGDFFVDLFLPKEEIEKKVRIGGGNRLSQ